MEFNEIFYKTMNSPPTSIWDWKTVGKLGKLAKLGDGWKCDYWWTKLPWNHHPNRREHVQNSIIIITLTVTSSMFAHSWEMFEWKEGRSILKWSKSPVESWNKHVRSFQSGPAARSRQLSIKDNIHDILLYNECWFRLIRKLRRSGHGRPVV